MILLISEKALQHNGLRLNAAVLDHTPVLFTSDEIALCYFQAQDNFSL